MKEFIAILKLHREHQAGQIERAVRTALQAGVPTLDGIQLLLRREQHIEGRPEPLDLAGRPQLQGIGEQPVVLEQYEQLLGGSQT